MTFDICFATYNSTKWLDQCLTALSKMDYDKKKVGLYFADNASQDDTVNKLEMLKQQYEGAFGAFEVLKLEQNMGFGTASNTAAKAGKGDFVFFFNVDTELFPDALTELRREILKCSPEWGAFEPRQFPYEHPKYYDPVTMETSWASGACMVLRRSVFEETGGFDETIFMYAEDVELSWHVRTLGYRIRYVPQAGTWHYAYKTAYEEKPIQVAGSLTGNLVLRYKYGTNEDIREWKHWKEIILERQKDETILSDIGKMLHRAEKFRSGYRRFYKGVVKKSTFLPQFVDLDYEFARAGAFYENHLPKKHPEITVIIRTYQRPETLALTLESLTHQTYKNFQVLVVEDGENPSAKDVVEKMKDRISICYFPLNRAAGRCVAGNIGLQRAQTEYVCFLDDDDYFFAEYLEVMACLIEENPDCKMFCHGAIEGACDVDPQDSTKFEFIRKRNNARKQLKRIDFFYDNPVPIQAVVFNKKLFEQFGGLDENLDALEDWDLWIRYVCHAKFAYAEKATSIYKIPARPKDYEKRDEEISKYRKAVFEKMASYQSTISAQDVYGLFWKPETAEEKIKQKDELKAYEKEIKESVREIQSSNSWKITAPLRWPFNTVRVVLNWIQLGINFVLGLLSKLFVGAANFIVKILVLLGRGVCKISLSWNKLADLVGPQKVDPDKEPIEKVHGFLLNSKKSVSMRLPQNVMRIVKKIKKREDI